MAYIAVYVLIILVMFFLTIRSPGAALAGVICIYGLKQWGQASDLLLFNYSIAANFAVAIAVLFGVMIQVFRGRVQIAHYPTVGKVLMAMYAFAILSGLWSVYKFTEPGGAIEQWILHGPYVLTLVILAPLLFQQLEDFRKGFTATMLIGSVILLLLIFTTEYAITGRGFLLVSGQQGNPLSIGSLGGHIALIALLMHFERGVSKIWVVLRWAIVIMAVYIAMRSNSRGQIVALFVAAGITLPLSRTIGNWKGFIALFFGSGFLVGLMAWLARRLSGSERWDLNEIIATFDETRLATVSILLKAWLDEGGVYLLLGLGNSASFSPEILRYYPHMVPLEILGELGLIGFGMLLAVYFLAGKNAIGSFRMVAPYPEGRAIVATVIALVIFNLLLSLKQGSFLNMAHLWAFIIMLGQMHGIIQRQMSAYYHQMSYDEWVYYQQTRAQEQLSSA